MAKVLLLTENYPPNVGGVANYLSNLVANLAPHAVTVVAPQDSRLRGNDIKEEAKIIRQKFYAPWIRPKWLPLFWRIKKMAREQKFDLVFCGKALFEGRLALKLKKSLGIPYAIFTYAMEIETWQSNARNKKQLQRVLAEADKIFYINEDTKKTLIELGATESQLMKVWPGVAENYLRPSENVNANIAEKYKLKKPYILSVARLIPRKGLDTLIEAFSKLDQTKWQQVQLVIGGDGPELQNLKEIAERNYVSKNVKFLGYVPEADLPALYCAAAFFALTPKETANDKEGFGIVYLEAASQGMPSVGTKTGGVPEAVLDAQTGLLVPPEDIEALKQALETLLSDEAACRRLGEAARARVISEFTWPKRAALVKEWLLRFNAS